MDIRAKVEARKAELRREQVRLEAEERARTEQLREAARAEVQKRVAVLEQGDAVQSDPPPIIVNDAVPTEADIERELDAALHKRAQDMWTSKENSTLFGLILAAFISFFIFGWILGLTLVVVSFIYLGSKNGNYKRQLRAELAQREGIASSSSI